MAPREAFLVTRDTRNLEGSWINIYMISIGKAKETLASHIRSLEK
jgi:hypothetical protein